MPGTLTPVACLLPERPFESGDRARSVTPVTGSAEEEGKKKEGQARKVTEERPVCT